MTIWVVIGIVVIALLAFFALQRPATTENMVENAETSTEETADAAAVRTEAAADLNALRVRAEAGETYEELQDEFAQVRARLAAAYENAEGATADEWQELEAGFDEFEASARAGTSNFLDSISSLMARFSADVRTDTEVE
ncbi:MAG TPA: hypothetical protein VEA92_03675 [Candidatus Paceibacterota bacterium]|nr:hypothetical protein [Candidatus Paceibacterota bacterium]